MQALLQETTGLREENTMLRIQASSSGPLRDQRSRGQGVNSRPDPELIYPGTTGVIPDVRNDRSRERPMPTYQAPQDESSDSTCLSSKRQRDKRPQLSDAMHARLGPQEPSKVRPRDGRNLGSVPRPPSRTHCSEQPPAPSGTTSRKELIK